MALYEERLTSDLAKIRDQVALVGSEVDDALEKSVTAVLEGDGDLATNVILNDHAVNRGFEHIDDMCHKFLALHLPSAGHLRLISIDPQNERRARANRRPCGHDRREAVQLSAPPTNESRRAAVVDMAGDSPRPCCHRRAIKAFNENDAELAQDHGHVGARWIKRSTRCFGIWPTKAKPSPIAFTTFGRDVGRLQQARAGQRAQAENICEETLFAITGESPSKRKVQDSVSRRDATAAKAAWPRRSGKN